MYSSVRIIVTGIVQGVGFRPFIHRLAVKYGLKGYVRNIGGSEVEIVLNGSPQSIASFIRSLYIEAPPPTVIEELEVYEGNSAGYTDFKIVSSGSTSYKRSMMPPDFSICSHCLKEILDPYDRRYRYPFNSCAWCGPRFSMMYRVPYDRENTSMRKYRLCRDCLEEYMDLGNIRRYHAQGISCPVDGPKLWLVDRCGEAIETSDPLKEASRLVDEGYIVAVKGIGGYHIAALASDDDVVIKLRERKRRPWKPFAIMALDLGVLNKLVYVSEEAEKILTSIQRPIVLLPKREDSPVSRLVSPGLDKEGVFLPYSGIHYLLLMETRDRFLIMTSGNVYGKPMCISEDCAFRQLGSIVDYLLIHDREIVNRVDDSVIRFTNGEPVLLRRGRGYAPKWVRLPFKLRREYIGFGGEFQTAGAIGFDNKIVLTQYIGDIEDVDVVYDLKRYLEFFIKNYRIDLGRAVLVIDKHPDYNTRLIAMDYRDRYGLEVVEVQHHVAHILGVVVDRGLEGRLVGVAIDGTGYGDDGAIWGGEVVEIDTYTGFYKRIGHLEYQPLIGEKSIYYPLRFFISVLSKIYSVDEIYDLIVREKLYERLPNGVNELSYVVDCVRKGYYTPTSSTGRFLDGVSAYLGVCWYRSYEGEPAIRLEATGSRGRLLDDFYMSVRVGSGGLVIDTTSVYKRLVESGGEYSVHDIARTIQYRLGEALGNLVARYLRGRRGYCSRVVVSGGAAVNDFIIKGLGNVLESEGYSIVLPKNIPVNDGGLAVGQIVYASRVVEK